MADGWSFNRGNWILRQCSLFFCKRHSAISCPWFVPSLFFSVQAKIWFIITHNTMQQLSGTLWGGSSMVERGPTHKHFVLSLWILVIALPGSAYFTHMTLIKMSRGLTHLLWGQSLITSIASGSITHAFKLHKYIHHVPPQSLCNKVYIIKHTFHLVRLIQEALQNIFTATHKINSLLRSDDKKSAGQSNSAHGVVSHTFSALWVRHCTIRSSCSV